MTDSRANNSNRWRQLWENNQHNYSVICMPSSQTV